MLAYYITKRKGFQAFFAHKYQTFCKFYFFQAVFLYIFIFYPSLLFFSIFFYLFLSFFLIFKKIFLDILYSIFCQKFHLFFIKYPVYFLSKVPFVFRQIFLLFFRHIFCFENFLIKAADFVIFCRTCKTKLVPSRKNSMNLQGNKTGKHDFFYTFIFASASFSFLPKQRLLPPSPLRFLCVFSIRFLFRLSSCFSRFFFNYICKYVKIYILIIL